MLLAEKERKESNGLTFNFVWSANKMLALCTICTYFEKRKETQFGKYTYTRTTRIYFWQEKSNMI